MDLDQVAAELYAGAPEDFTARRKTRADEARAAGDRSLAKQITALRRPTRSAWIVNLLTDQAADELAELLDLGAALVQAQQQLSGPELRRLSGRRHAAIAALVRRGTQLAEVRGHTPSEATLREVSATLQAALSDPEIAAEVRQGRLAQPREYSGFGPQLTFAPPAVQDQQFEETADDDRQSSAGGDAETDHDQLLEQLSRAQSALDRIRTAAQHAQQRVDRAAETAQRTSARVTELKDQLRRAEQEAATAAAKLADHRTAVEDLRRDEQAAEAAVSEALAQLAGDD
ncbi:hypothetical protein FOE78_00560 [Microlunatus elymi]|uniref:Uncharacterized protein n=1 Tax=Microlunatus elymi TaxID=2596828 RepID=A0A516PTT2_9ACTN|nr:hypothetical protein [Microlunatus elymi]QDP94605.1 hypothetical protein FOE78_00560 [Microlunatus elymi]